jgi:predicted nucleic acid-binding protein
MISVDSNLLFYAHREDSPWHPAAYARIVELSEVPQLGRSHGRAFTNFYPL